TAPRARATPARASRNSSSPRPAGGRARRSLGSSRRTRGGRGRTRAWPWRQATPVYVRLQLIRLKQAGLRITGLTKGEQHADGGGSSLGGVPGIGRTGGCGAGAGADRRISGAGGEPGRGR